MKISDEELEVVKEVINAEDHTALKRIVKRNVDLLSDMYNKYYSELEEIALPDTKVTQDLNKLWKYIDNLSEKDGEMLEACSDFYMLCLALDNEIKE